MKIKIFKGNSLSIRWSSQSKKIFNQLLLNNIYSYKVKVYDVFINSNFYNYNLPSTSVILFVEQFEHYFKASVKPKQLVRA